LKQQGVKELIVDEWDTFEIEREEHNIKKYNEEKGEMETMSKFSMVVRLSKDFNNAEIGIHECDSVEELLTYENWAKTKVQQIVEQLPTYKKDTPLPKYTPKEYVQKEEAPKMTGQKVQLSDITTEHGSKKQHGFLVQGINKGIFTLHEVNSAPDYNTISELVKKFFANNKR
jgi:hypothetical protein